MATVGQAIAKRLGRFIAGRNPTPRPRPFGEMGTSGTAVWGGYVQVKERSPEWIGRQKYITSSDLAINTSIVAAGVHYFLNLVAYPQWTFRAADEDDEESLALAQFAEDALNDMDTPWYKVVRRAAMYRFHGFGLQEWTAKHRDDGLIGFKDIEARPQQTIEQWDVDDDGTVLGVWQRSPQTGAMLGIPRDKLLYLVEDTLTDSPEGIGMFRHMADPYQRLKQMQQLEIRAFERDLRGTPIARAPLTMLDQAVASKVITQAEADAMVTDFESLVRLQVKQSDTGIVMDSLPYFSDSDAGQQVSGLPQWSFELLQGGGVGHAEIAAAIDRVQREIARIIGVEHLMMGDTGGNRSLAEDKSRNLYLIANSVLKYIAAQVKGDILIPLWRLNGFPMKKLPEPKPEDVTFKNVDAVTNAISKMSSAGAVLAPNDPVINDVRDLLGVSRVPDDVMAAGAMNPALAGLPPQLQMGGGGGIPGGPPRMGGGGPGKQPGFGGGALPGKGGEDQFGKKSIPWYEGNFDDDSDDDEVTPESRSAPSEERPRGVTDASAAQPEPAARAAGQAQAAPGSERTPAQQGDLTELDLNGAKPGGKVAVSTDLLIRLLERLSGEQAPMAGQSFTDEGKPKPAGHPTAEKPQEGASPAGVDPKAPEASEAEQADPKAQGPKAQQSPGGPQLQPELEEEADGKPVAAGAPAEAGAVREEEQGKPPGQFPIEKPGPAADKPAGPEGEAGAKPAAAGGDPAGKPAATAKPGQPGQPTGTAPEGAAAPGAGEPPMGPPGAEPAGAVPGMAPGTPPGMEPPEPEMTPERASAILQPYADHSIPPEEDHPKTESDLLWTRLGDEKDVGPVGAEMAEAPAGTPPIDTGEAPEGIEAAGGGAVEEEPPAGAVNGVNEDEAAIRARLRQQIDAEGLPASEVEEEAVPPEEEEEGAEAAPPKARVRERLDPEAGPPPKSGVKPKPKKLPRPRVRL